MDAKHGSSCKSSCTNSGFDMIKHICVSEGQVCTASSAETLISQDIHSCSLPEEPLPRHISSCICQVGETLCLTGRRRILASYNEPHRNRSIARGCPEGHPSPGSQRLSKAGGRIKAMLQAGRSTPVHVELDPPAGIVEADNA